MRTHKSSSTEIICLSRRSNMDIQKLAQNTKEASIKFQSSSAQNRNNAIKKISELLLERASEIEAENKKDIIAAQENNLSSAMIDRLLLTQDRIKGMAQTAIDIAAQEEVVGKIISEKKRPNGLVVKKQQIPLGVIAMIFESRPNVVIDCSCLAIKSGNGIILKGGKEAAHSNRILTQLVKDAIDEFIPSNIIQLIEDRNDVKSVITLNDSVDVVIPRGGEKLIQYVYDNASIPVIAHFKGLCHIYVHADADISKAKDIILNAKTQRPGVCNAMETLLLHKDLPENFKIDILKALLEKEVELHATSDLHQLNDKVMLATDEDYATEWLDKKLSIKTVVNEDEAIAHIQKYGSNHTEAILAKDPKAIEKFQMSIDASCIAVNASTRFNDGGELGLGAELGISTTKFHSYGPMGASEMTTSRFIIEGDGHIRP